MPAGKGCFSAFVRPNFPPWFSCLPSSAFVSGTNGDPAPGKATERERENLHTPLEKTDRNRETERRNVQGEKEEHDELAEPRWLSPSTDHFSQQPAPIASRKPTLAGGYRRQISTPAASRGQERGAAGSTGAAPGNAVRKRRSPIFLNDGEHRNPTAEAAAAAGALPDEAMPLVRWPPPPGHRRHLRRRTAAPGAAGFAGDFQSAAKASPPMAGTGANSPSFRLRQPCASFLLRRGPEPPVP